MIPETSDMCRFFVGNFLGILTCLLFGLQPSMRDYLALKENSKTSLEGLVRSRSDSGSEWGTKLVQRPHPPICFAMRDCLRVCEI